MNVLINHGQILNNLIIKTIDGREISVPVIVDHQPSDELKDMMAFAVTEPFTMLGVEYSAGIVICAELWNKWDIPLRTFIVCHEAAHVALNHTYKTTICGMLKQELLADFVAVCASDAEQEVALKFLRNYMWVSRKLLSAGEINRMTLTMLVLSVARWTSMKFVPNLVKWLVSVRTSRRAKITAA